MYQEALDKRGHNFKLKLEEGQCNIDEGEKKAKKRKRHIIWFNPPYSRTVQTNVGGIFLQLMEWQPPQQRK